MKNFARKSFNLLCIFAMVFVAMFCFANVGSVKIQEQPNIAIAESAEVVGVDATTAVDVSSYASWEDFTEMPNVQNLGSLDEENNHAVISNAAQLAWVAKMVNENNSTYKGFDGWTLELDADIDLAGKIWTPIGNSSSYPFKGDFYGNGHIIHGLTFLRPSNKGLFSYCWGTHGEDTRLATVADVIIKNCVNVSNFALVGGTTGLVKNCQMILPGVESMSNTAKLHCVTNGETANNRQASLDEDYNTYSMGVGEFFYEFVVFDDQNEIARSNAGVTTGSRISLSNVCGADQTIAKVAIKELNPYYSLDSSDPLKYEWEWDEKVAITPTSGQKVYSYNTLSFSLTSGGTVAKRGYSSSLTESIGSSGNSLSGQIKYVHQSAVRIEITLAKRNVSVTTNYYMLGSADYNEAISYYTLKSSALESGILSSVSTSAAVLGAVKVSVDGGADQGVSSYLAVPYGSTVTFKYLDVGMRAYGIATDSDFTSDGAGVDGWHADGESFSVEITPEANSAAGTLTYEVNIYINNVGEFKIKRAYASYNSTTGLVEVENKDMTVYYYCTNEDSYGCCELVFPSDASFSVMGPSNVSVATMMLSTASDTALGNKSMSGSYVFATRASMSGLSGVSIISIGELQQEDAQENFILNGVKEFVAGWVLTSVNVTIPASGDVAIVAHKENPYTNLISEIDSGWTISTDNTTKTIAIPATFKVWFACQQALTDLETLNVYKVGSSNDDVNIYEYYENTILDDKFTNKTLTELEDDAGGKLSHGLRVKIFSPISYEFSKLSKRFKYKIDLVVKDKNGNTVSSDPTTNAKININSLTWGTATTSSYGVSEVLTWDYVADVTKQYTATDMSCSTSGVSVQYSVTTNNKIEFTISGVDGLNNGDTVSLTLTLTQYVNEYEWQIWHFYNSDYTGAEKKLDITNNDVVIKKDISTNEIGSTITVQVKYLSFEAIRIGGTKVYDVRSGAATEYENNLEIEVEEAQAGTEYQTVKITVKNLAKHDDVCKIHLDYRVIEYKLSINATFDGVPSNKLPSKTSSELSFIYSDKVSVKKQTVSETSGVRVSIGETTDDFAGLAHYIPQVTEISDSPLLDYLDKNNKTITIDFVPKGITIKYEFVGVIAGVSKKGDDYNYKTQNETLTMPSAQYHKFEKITWDKAGTDVVASNLSYYDLSVKAGDKETVTIYGHFTPYEYTIKFSGKTPSGGNAGKGDKTGIKYGDTTALSACVNSVAGYTTIITGYSLDSTLGDVVKKAGSTTSANEITLEVTYSAKGATIYFKYDGKTYASTTVDYTAEVDWADLVAKSEVELRKKSLLATEWKYGNLVIAEYNGYDATKGCFTYNISDEFNNKQSLKKLVDDGTFDEFKTQYVITATVRSTSVDVTFDGTYLTDAKAFTTKIGFNKSTYDKTPPTPTRQGYTFAYWKAIDSEDKKWVVKGTEGETSTILTSDSALTFYAYWKVNKATISSKNYNATYDGAAHNISITATVPSDMAVESAFVASNNSATIAVSGNTIVATLSGIKYAGSYDFSATFTYQFKTASASDRTSAFYIIDAKDYSTLNGSATAKITAKTLTVDTITKVYDGNEKVLQAVKGIYDEDAKAGFVVSGKYASVSAGTGIAVTFTARGATKDILNSYSVPTGKKGAITAKQINVTIGGSVSYSGEDDNNIIVAKGYIINPKDDINKRALTVTENNGNIFITNLNEITDLLASDRTLSFEIHTKGKSSAKTYAEGDLGVTLTDTHGNDFVIKITSTFEIKALASGYMTFDFYSRVYNHGGAVSVAGLNVEDYVASVSSDTDTTRVISNYKFNVTTEVAANSTAKINIVASFIDANWWLNSATIVDRKTETKTVVDIGLYATKTYYNYSKEVQFTVGANTYYDVYLEFTNVSRVEFELGDFAKGITTQPETAYVTYGSSFTVPEGAINGLGFNKWFYVASNGANTDVKAEKIDWNIKGDITLFALWTYKTTITMTGENVSATYNPSKSYTFKAENGNTTAPLTYSYKWQYCKTQNGTFADKATGSVSPSQITVKNVADSGYYLFVFGVSGPQHENGVECVSFEIEYKTGQSISSTVSKYSVSITKKAITLKNAVDKYFDGETTLEYTIANGDVDATYAELVAQKVTITYTGLNAGETVKGVSSLANYTFSASGSILKREFTIAMGKNSFEYNEGVQTVNPSNISLDKLYSYSGNAGKIDIKNIAISTNSASVGVYNQQSGNVVVAFNAILAKDGKTSVNATNFTVTVTGEIVIYARQLGEITVGESKVYNANIQVPDVYIFGNQTPLTKYFSVKYDGEWIIENGAVTVSPKTNSGEIQPLCDVGSYEVEIVVAYPNYLSQTINTTISITQRAVFVEVVKQNISKVYDGSAVLDSAYLQAGSDYYLYSSKDKVALADEYKTDIANYESVVFTFDNANVGTSKPISIYAEGNPNYEFTLINTNLKGSITKKGVRLSVSSSASKVYDEKTFTISIGKNWVTASGLASGETLGGSFEIKVTNAGTYNLANGQYTPNVGNVSTLANFSLANYFDFAGLKIGTKSLLNNYSISAVSGTITIAKANIELVVSPTEYVYTGAVQEVGYSVTRTIDNKKVTEIVEVIKNDGVNVGSHLISFGIKDEYQNNYNNTLNPYVSSFDDNGYVFTITKKPITLVVNETKTFDQKVFTVLLNQQKYNAILCEGHNFGDSFVKSIYSYAYTYTYENSMLSYSVKIYDANSAEVTSNYTITYDMSLSIGKADIDASDIVAKNDYVYENKVHNITFSVLGIPVNFTATKFYATTAHETTSGDVVVYTKFARIVSATAFENTDFKYASKYKVTVEGNGFNAYSFEMEIKPKTITSFSITYDGTTYETINGDVYTRQYDGTEEIYADIVSADIYADDASMVMLTGKLAKEFGDTTIPVSTFKYSFPQDYTGSLINQIKASYVIASNLLMNAKITEREVTLTYIGTDTFYYTSKKLKLAVSSMFRADNIVSGESFGGYLEFRGIVDANTYDFAVEGKDVNVSELTISENSELAYYKISYAGQVVINKAQLVVSNVENNNVTYSDSEKEVLLTASIKAYRGEIVAGTEQKLLYADYTLAPNLDFVPAINVANYYIYPFVAKAYQSNYEYVGDEYLSDKLAINKKKVEVYTEKEVTYDETREEYKFDEIDIVVKEIIDGHTFNGMLTIALDKLEAGKTYLYTSSEQTDGMEIAEFNIYKSASSVLSNYDVSYNITIVIVDRVVDGGYRALAQEIYVYSSVNQIETVAFNFDIGLGGQIITTVIRKNTPSAYAKIENFYATREDAENGQSPISEIINIGEYYIKVLVDKNGNSVYTDTPCYARVKVIEKTISVFTLKDDLTGQDNPFTGTRVYTAESSSILQSADVFALDKNKVTLTVTYYDKNNNPVADAGYGYTAKITMAGEGIGNYTLGITEMDGVIEKRVVIVTKYTDATVYRYAGQQNIVLDYTKFTVEKQVAGHTLSGSVTVEVSDVGTYEIYQGINQFGIMSTVDVSENYVIEIDKSLKLVINKAEVTISWTESAYIYNSQDRVPEIIETLNYYGTYTEGTKEDIVLTFNSGESVVRNVGSYVITGATSKSENYNYTIDETDNTVVVSQKQAEIDYGISIIKWKEYQNAGYAISYSMIDGAYIADKELFEQGIYKITLANGETHRANTTYYAESGEDLDESAIGPFHRYGKITTEFADIIWNNYNLTFKGGFNIIPEVITFKEVESFIYNSEDRFAEVVVKYSGEDGEEKTITKDNTANGKITQQYMEDAGDYTLLVEINTALYYVPVVINVRPITIIKVAKNKQYDGTTKAYNQNGSEFFGESDMPEMVAGDDLVVTANYAGYRYSEETYAITFSMSGSDITNYSLPENYSGKIAKRVVTFNFGTWNQTYNVDNSYTVTYQGDTTVTGGVVDKKVITFSLINNAVKDYIEITEKTANINTENFTIVLNQTTKENVTDCYDITFNIAIVLTAKEFEIAFNGFENNQVVFDATEKRVTIVATGLTDSEQALVLSNFVIEYKDAVTDDIFANGKYPINIGTYTAIANYKGSANYLLVGNNEYTFQILPYTFNVDVGDIAKISKEYSHVDPELSQKFTIKFTNANYSFNVLYTREQGEEVGTYDLYLADNYIDTNNITFVPSADALNDKFEITINKSNIVVITIKSYKNGEFARYYGFKDIGLFNLSEFTYTTILKGEEETPVNGGILANSTVLFNSGDVGNYVVKSCEISSSNFERFEIESDIEFTIKKRTLVVYADTYDKVYDGTTEFLSELKFNFNSVPAEGELSAEEQALIGEILAVVTYASSDVGTRALALELSTQTQNFNARLAENTGKITKLGLLVNVGSQSLVYGSEVELEYTVEYADASIPQVFTYSELRGFVTVSIENATLSTAGYIEVGTYNVLASTTENFEITNAVTASVTISRKEITVVVTPKIFKVEDGLTRVDLVGDGYTVETDGIIDGDIVSVPYADFTNPAAGTNKVISFVLDGKDSKNYQAKTTRGEIGQKIITFVFNYYDYVGCPVLSSQVNGSTTSVKVITYDYYSSINAQKSNSLPSPAFIGKGYQFVGWSTTTDNSGIINPDIEISTFIEYSETVQVYAIWDIQKFDITIYSALYNFASNNYDITKVTTVREYYQTSVDVSAYINAPAHYTYSGYGIGSTSVLYTSEYKIVDNAELYLVYALDRQVVTLNANDGVFTNLTSKFAYQSAGIATFEVFYGQKIGDVLSVATLTQHMVVTKQGYVFNLWEISGTPVTASDIAEYVVLDNISVIAKWTPNKYALVLDGADGVFSLTEEQQNLGWTYVSAGSYKQVQILVDYNGQIPELVKPVKEFYTFAGFVDYLAQPWSESVNTKWTTLGGATLTATYKDSDYTLTIVAENATASIVAKDGMGVVINLVNTSVNPGVYTYAVKTSYYVTISATANAGYTFANFEDSTNSGIAFNDTYTFTSFKDNSNVKINVTANKNTITLTVNNNDYGFISSVVGGEEYASNTENFSFELETGSSAIIVATIFEGYEINAWYVDGTAELTSLGENKVVSGFTSDTTILVEIAPKQLNIQIVNNAEKGEFYYDGTSYTESKAFAITTGEVMEITITPNYGYGIDLDAIEFATESTNKGVLVKVAEENAYKLTLSNFTADGTIAIVYTTKQFTLTFGYAEYDEQTQTISNVETANNIVKIGEVEYANGNTAVLEFMATAVVSPLVEKTGYQFYGYYYVTGETYSQMIGSVDANGVITFVVDNNYELLLVYQRQEFTVTYTVSNPENAELKFVEGELYGSQVSETVRFGRTISDVELKLVDEYRDFAGWNNGQTVVSTNLVLSGIEIQGDTNFEAVVTGLSGQQFDVIINANSSYEVADDINTILSAENATVGMANQSLDENGNIVITIPVTYNVGDEIRLSIAVKDYYQAYNDGAIGDNFDFNLGALTPATYSADSSFVINLALRYYEVKIMSETERAVTFSPSIGESVGFGSNSNFNPTGTTIATAYVQYGGTLVAYMTIADGYRFVGQTGDASFDILDNKVTLNNINKNVVIKFNFERTRYKITFKTNYPTNVFNEPLENVVNKEFVFYISQDESVLKNVDGSVADISGLIASQTFENSSDAVFAFLGWSIISGVGVARSYLFDNGGMYYISDGGVKVYGFNDCIAVDADNDGIVDQENGNIITNLYGSWSLPAYQISIEYAPDTISYTGEYANFFENAVGFITQDGLKAAEGVDIKMTATPVFGDYVYYGWCLKGETQVNTEIPSLTMPGEDITIVLYYQFYVEIKLEESIAGANQVTLNSESVGGWFIVGQELLFKAICGEGFVFKHWKLQDAVLDGFGAEFSILATNKQTYTAVFEGMAVAVELRNTAHSDISWVQNIAGVEQVVQNLKVGDTLRVKINSVDYGYVLKGVSINGSTEGVSKHTSGAYYEYIIKQVDGTNGVVYVDSIVNARNVNITFRTNLESSAIITVNNVDLTNLTQTYSYDEVINIVTTVQPRYKLLGISINGTPIETVTEFAMPINQTNGFAFESGNTILFELEKLYWIDVRQSLVGYGTKEAPYLIANAENLAYMAYIINNGIIDQSLNRIYYKVTNDIDLSERFWIPIGTEENPFDGTFILGAYKITGVSFAEKYETLSWAEYCEGVFGYITEGAEIVIEQSMLPTIIILVVVGVLIIIIIVVIIIIVRKRKKKMKKLSEKLTVTNAQPKTPQPKKPEPEKQPDMSKEELDAEVKEILARAKQEADDKEEL